jgi:ABC-2 type transport system ATP-binding protein
MVEQVRDGLPVDAGTEASSADAVPDGGDAVLVRGLTKSYGDLTAVAGVDLRIGHGEVFALLGPNGAGKTTTVEILEASAAATAGRYGCWASTPAVVNGPG